METETPAPPTPEDIQHDMADTRRHLTAQVQALGDRFMGMASDASDAVTGAVQGGKDAAAAVQGAIRQAGVGVAAAAEQVLDVRGHVRRHPWLAVGCAAALGFYCGGFLRR